MMNLEVKIEIKSIVEKITGKVTDGNTHNFIVFVRGLNGNKIEHFVKQVVFYLPSKSKQVKRYPPYLISGSAHTSFRLPIDIFLCTSDGRNKVRYSYYVYLPDKPVENAVNVKTLTFLNIPQDFRERLLLGGAEVVNQINADAFVTRIKSEPVETLENQETAGCENNTFNLSVENLGSETEPTEGAGNENGINYELPNSCVQNEDFSEQNGSLQIQGIYSFDELSKENEILKKENEALLHQFNQQEGVITGYAEKLPVLEDDFSAVSTELSELQKKAEDNEKEMSNLKSSIQMLMSEILKNNEKVEEVQGNMKKQKKSAVMAHV